MEKKKLEALMKMAFTRKTDIQLVDLTLKGKHEGPVIAILRMNEFSWERTESGGWYHPETESRIDLAKKLARWVFNVPEPIPVEVRYKTERGFYVEIG